MTGVWARSAPAVVMLALIMTLAACGGDDVAADEARLSVSGLVTLTPPDGGARVVDRGQTVDFGDVVQVDEGTATLTFAGGDLYELRAGSDRAQPSRIEVAAPPRVLSGDVLLSEGFPLGVEVGDANVTARGPTRVRSDVPSAASYAGATQISGVAGVAEVIGLRSVQLTDGAVAVPIEFNADDSWDRRYLGEAHTFGERLEALSRGYTADLQPNTGLTAAFYETVLPDLEREPGFTDSLLLPSRPAGENLVGAAIALAGSDATFRDRWAAIFEFRDQGASWGLVAHEQRVSSTSLLDTLEVALGASPLSDDPLPTTTTTTVPEPDEPTSTTTVPESSPTTTAPPETAPPTTEPEPESDGLLGSVLEPVGGLLDDLLEVLGLGGDDEDEEGR